MQQEVGGSSSLLTPFVPRRVKFCAFTPRGQLRAVRTHAKMKKLLLGSPLKIKQQELTLMRFSSGPVLAGTEAASKGSLLSQRSTEQTLSCWGNRYSRGAVGVMELHRLFTPHHTHTHVG